MIVYCTSKNSGPWTSDSVYLIYLGTSITEAINAVGDFSKYKKEKEEFPKKYDRSYSALPRDINREMIQYYVTDGYWYSIEKFELNGD